MASVKPGEQRTYGGQTGGERATQRRAALVEAAFGLVAETGWRGLSIEALCRAAGLNKRYFYESFRTLDAVVEAVLTWLAEDAITVTLAAAESDRSPHAHARLAITAMITHLTDDPRRARVLFGAVPGNDAAAVHRAEAIHEVIAAAAAEGRSVHAVADDSLIDVTAAMLVGGTSQAVLDWLDGRLACTRDELIEDLIVLWQSVGDAAGMLAAGRESRG